MTYCLVSFHGSVVYTECFFFSFLSFIRDVGMRDGIVRARRLVQRRLDSSAQVSGEAEEEGVIDVEG